jgi:D-alanyl-lipoteichoic acid acyltransferase DltB (MBOAT superfamily)
LGEFKVLFVDPSFIFIWLPIAVSAFFTATTYKRSLALPVIVVASAIFYAPYGKYTVLLLIFSLLVNYTIGMRLSTPADKSPKFRKVALIIGLAFNFCLLFIFKYVNTFMQNLIPSFSLLTDAAIPAGISFYTFHQAVFLIDAHSRRPEISNYLGSSGSLADGIRGFIKYAAFVAFFPQLVIGPIVYMREFAGQASQRSFGHFRKMGFQLGFTLIILGLFKKLCIADSIATVSEPIYRWIGEGFEMSAGQASFAITGYFFQLYFDFSGYSDIAVGIGHLFGIRLPINFESPLRAHGIIDYYKRWHITLTRVISRFLYTPISLVGTRAAMERGYSGWRLRAFASWMPILINFQVIALWHGAKETFLLFGLIHGAWYLIETETRSAKLFVAWQNFAAGSIRTVLGQGITIVPLMLTFALFRCETIAGFKRLLQCLWNWGPIDSPAVSWAPVTTENWVMLAAIAAVVYLAPNTFELTRKYYPGLRTTDNPSSTPPFLRLAWRPNHIWTIFIGVMMLSIFFRLNEHSPFLYGGF